MPEQETAANVRTGETVTREVATADEAYVAALLREREGYARMEREDRVQAVDAELERLGYVWEEKVVDDGEDEDAGGDGKDGPPAPPHGSGDRAQGDGRRVQAAPHRPHQELRPPWRC